MPPNTQVRTIRVIADTKGNAALRDIAKQMGLLNREVKGLSGSMQFLKNQFVGFAAFFGVREIVNMSDEIQLLNNRLVTVTGSQEEASKVMGDLNSIANSVGTTVDSLATTYTRLALSLRDTNIGQGVLLDITKTLQNTFKLSGSATSEATGTIIQLSQAFSSGQVRGQELRTVLEQNAELALLLRKRFGGDIFKQAEKGLISAADVMEVLFDNMERINTSADKFVPTIGQSLTKALNVLKIALLDINQEFGLAKGFAAFIDFGIKKIPVLATAVGVVLVGAFLDLIIATKLFTVALSGSLIPAIGALARAAFAFTISNPFTALFAVAAAGVLLLVDSFDDLRLKLKQLQVLFFDTFASIAGGIERLTKGTRFQGILPKGLADEAKKTSATIKGEIDSLRKKIAQEGSGGIFSTKQERDDYLRFLNNLYGQGNKELKLEDILAGINREIKGGAIGFDEYQKKVASFELEKLNREFRDGKIAIEQYNEAVRKLRREDLNRQLNIGVVTLNQYNQAIEQIDQQALNEKLNAGTISLQQYNAELAKISQSFSAQGAIRTGTQAYVDSLTSTTNQIANGITRTFQSLEDNLLEFIKTGTFNFKKFAEGILDELTRIIIRASIIRPLAEGILSGFGAGAGATGGVGTPTADGTTAVSTFAKGGVFNAPTPFGYGSNKLGIMGEAGPEAILPLSRGSNGALGVQATVTPVNINIINNSSAQVEQRETQGPGGERLIEVLIQNKVKDGIANGTFDKSMGQAYGLRRKGS